MSTDRGVDGEQNMFGSIRLHSWGQMSHASDRTHTIPGLKPLCLTVGIIDPTASFSNKHSSNSSCNQLVGTAPNQLSRKIPKFHFNTKMCSLIVICLLDVISDQISWVHDTRKLTMLSFFLTLSTISHLQNPLIKKGIWDGTRNEDSDPPNRAKQRKLISRKYVFFSFGVV